MGDHGLNNVGDVAGASVVLLWMNSYLPAVATLFTVIWFAIRIIETETVRGVCAWIAGRCKKKPKPSNDDDMPTEME